MMKSSIPSPLTSPAAPRSGQKSHRDRASGTNPRLPSPPPAGYRLAALAAGNPCGEPNTT